MIERYADTNVHEIFSYTEWIFFLSGSVELLCLAMISPGR